jgi:hypothetical protein
MQILDEIEKEYNVNPGDRFIVRINNDEVYNYKIKNKQTIEKVLVFGNLFEKPEDFCMGALLGTEKAIHDFKKIVVGI